VDEKLSKEEYNNSRDAALYDFMQKCESVAQLDTFVMYVIKPLVKNMSEESKQWLRDAYVSKKMQLEAPDPKEFLKDEQVHQD